MAGDDAGPCLVEAAKGEAQLDLGSSGLGCEEASSIHEEWQQTASSGAAQGTGNVAEVRGWTCTSATLTEHPLLATCESGQREFTVSAGGAEADGPSGELSPDGIGAVAQGDSREEVERAFGEPDAIERVSGCELNQDAAELVQLLYELDGGELWVNLERSSGELISYRTESETLATEHGNRVGDPYESLEEDWGERLQKLEPGGGTTRDEGFWTVEQGPRSQLLFGIRDGDVQSISGGFLPPCD